MCIIDRHIGDHIDPPWLWENVIAYVLLLWAAPTLAVLGLLFLWQTRRRRRSGTRLE
jgi:uncharacterized protein (TIGR03382 family)